MLGFYVCHKLTGAHVKCLNYKKTYEAGDNQEASSQFV